MRHFTGQITADDVDTSVHDRPRQHHQQRDRARERRCHEPQSRRGTDTDHGQHRPFPPARGDVATIAAAIAVTEDQVAQLHEQIAEQIADDDPTRAGTLLTRPRRTRVR